MRRFPPDVDSWAFWNEDYPAITAIEDFGDQEENPYYHTVNDTMSSLNPQYFTSFVKAAVGTVAHLAIPMEYRVVLPTVVN